MAHKWKSDLKNITCDKCGYNNKETFALYFGTCLRCKNVINKKANFRYEMNKRLGLWRKEKKNERKFIKNN